MRRRQARPGERSLIRQTKHEGPRGEALEYTAQSKNRAHDVTDFRHEAEDGTHIGKVIKQRADKVRDDESADHQGEHADIAETDRDHGAPAQRGTQQARGRARHRRGDNHTHCLQQFHRIDADQEKGHAHHRGGPCQHKQEKADGVQQFGEHDAGGPNQRKPEEIIGRPLAFEDEGPRREGRNEKNARAKQEP